jgi:hypothetical protein
MKRLLLVAAALLLGLVVALSQRFGMNVEGLDNKQLALNIIHWLSRDL